MRIHKIDNDRTRRHMYKNANECVCFKQIINHDDLVYTFGHLDDIRSRFESILQAFEKRMIHKYHRKQGTPPIDVHFFHEYDRPRPRDSFLMEARYNPNRIWDA